jgi:hypothetical protein
LPAICGLRWFLIITGAGYLAAIKRISPRWVCFARPVGGVGRNIGMTGAATDSVPPEPASTLFVVDDDGIFAMISRRLKRRACG